MAEPTITEIQEQIIELDGVRFHLVDVSREERPDEKKHQSWCWKCDGRDPAPCDDEDRLHIFDHYCYGSHFPLCCDPIRGKVYKRVLI